VEAGVKVLPLSAVKTRLSELVDVVDRRDEPLTITRNGKPIAIIVSKEEYDGWHETVEILRDPQLMKEIRDGIRRLARTKKRRTLDELFAD
jgi:prevent-host-death family protein